MRAGVRLALDMGARRIGVARSDVDGVMAVPVAVLDAEGDAWLQSLAALITEHSPIEVVVGDPISLRGRPEQASEAVHRRVAELQMHFPNLPVRLVDERLTTAVATRRLREAGHSSRSARPRVDAAAAVEILEFALDVERRSGQPAGALL